MFASRYTRSGVFAWAPAGLERQGLIVADWAQQFDASLNASGQAALDYVDVGDLATPRPRPTSSLHSEYRVNSAVWCSLPHAPSQHPSGLLLAGCDNGRFVALDAQAIVDGSSLSVVSARADHRGGVTALAVSACNKWAMSGAGAGQLLLWDLSNLQQPFSPGQPSFQDQVKALQWNREMENICASLSSHRTSLWDMRHPGAPIMELGEIGGGVDWQDLAWSPLQGTLLLTASQSDALPLLYKWDLRYPSAPVGDLRIHQRGITSLDWSTADPRLLLSASHDGQILLTDPETSQMMGRCGVSSTDRVRVARWSPGRPHLVAIQYHQQPIQLTSLQPIGQKEEADAELLVDLYTVPKWEAAAPVGCSFSMGGRQAVHLAERDENGQMQYRVEIRRVLGSQCVYERAMRLQNAGDGGQLEEMCQERAAESLSPLSSEVWRWLGARAAGGGRSAYLKMLQSEGEEEVHLSASAPPTSRSARSQSSVGTEREERGERASAGREDSEVHNTLTSSYATSSTTTTNNTTSSMGGARSGQHRVTSPSAHSTVSSEEDDLDMAEWPAVEWDRVDAAGWSALDSFIRRDYITVVEDLLSRGDWAGAFVFCSHDEKWTKWLVDKYMTEKDMTSSTRLVLTASLDGAHHLSGGGEGGGGGGAEWPRIEWKRQLALLMLSQHGASALSARLRHLADRWTREDPSDLLPCIPAILLGDVEQLLASNDSLPIEERVEQAVILRASCKADKKHKQHGTGPLLESLLLSWCARLRDEGCMDAAWRLLADIEPHAESLSTLRHCLWEACGGRERTQRPAPPCPYEAERRALAASMQGQRRPSVPPSSSFMNGGSQPYPQPSQFHSYPAMGGGAGGMMAPPPLAPPPSSYGQPMMAPPPVAPPPMGGGGYGYGGQMAPPPPVMAPPPMAPPMMQPQQQQPSPTSMNGYSGGGGGYQRYQPSPSMSQQPLPPQQQPLRPGSAASSAASLQHLPPQTPTLGGSGWNDPPPMMAQKKQQPRPVSVMQVSWNPSVATVRPSGEVGGGGGMEVYGGVGMGMQIMQGQPSQSSAAAAAPPPPAPVDLSPEDRQLMDTFTQLADAVLASGRVPATVRKAEDIKTKLAAELAPRLATNKLSPTTRQLLWQISQCGSSGDWRAASAGCAHMVRAGGDFVEVSPFVPALKSLYSLAQQTFPR